MKNQTSRLVVLALLVAAGILLQIMESFLPISWLIPGYKIGLANIVGLYALYVFGIRDMILVTYTRIILASLCMGTLFSIPFILSLCGGTLALLAMAAAYKSKWFSIYGVSVAGAAGHTIGQVLAISVLYQQFFMQLFLPVLLALSIVSGLLIALLARFLIDTLSKRRTAHV